MNPIRPEPASLPSPWPPPSELHVENHDDVTLLPLDTLPLGAAPVRLRVGMFGAQGEMIAGFAGSAFQGLMLGRDVQARIAIFSRHPKVEEYCE